MLMNASREPVRIRITPDLLQIFERFRLQTAQRRRARWKIGDVLSILPAARLEPYAHILAGFSVPAALGAFSYGCAPLSPTIRIGRYSSIAAYFSEFGRGHPTDWISTSPFSHNPQPMGGFAAYLVDRGIDRFHVHDFDEEGGPIEIGNDVWIGEHVLVKPGITIGDGAIVAARAVVTKDVPPYAIVGGLPARLIRYRLPEELIPRVQASQWWRFGPDVLQPLDVRDPARFLDRFEQALARGIEPLNLPILSGQEIIAAGETIE